LWLIASFGGVFGGLLGYAQNKKAETAAAPVKFQWEDFVTTLGIAVVGGGLWTLASYKEFSFGAVTIITGFIFGGGIDYFAKKTIIT
jgi:hypothetical protein